MITFNSRQCERILARQQTVTTRLGRQRWKLNGIHEIRKGRQGPVVGHVRIVGLPLVKLGTLTAEDVQEEGYPDLPSFRRHWRDTYGTWRPAQLVRRRRFVVIPEPEKRKQTTLPL